MNLTKNVLNRQPCGRTTLPVTYLISIWTVSTPSTELSFATSTQARSVSPGFILSELSLTLP